MATSVKQMMEAANAAVPKITATEAREKIAKGNTLLLDIRDGTEVQASGTGGAKAIASTSKTATASAPTEGAKVE